MNCDGRQTAKRPDRHTDKHRVFIELLPAAKDTKGHELYASSGLIQKSRKIRIVGYNDFAGAKPSSKTKSTGPLKYALKRLETCIKSKKKEKNHNCCIYVTIRMFFWVKLTFGFVVPIKK